MTSLVATTLIAIVDGAGSSRQHYAELRSRGDALFEAIACSVLLATLAALSLPSPWSWLAAVLPLATAPLLRRFMFKPQAYWLDGVRLVEQSGSRSTYVEMGQPV